MSCYISALSGSCSVPPSRFQRLESEIRFRFQYNVSELMFQNLIIVTLLLTSGCSNFLEPSTPSPARDSVDAPGHMRIDPKQVNLCSDGLTILTSKTASDSQKAAEIERMHKDGCMGDDLKQ